MIDDQLAPSAIEALLALNTGSETYIRSLVPHVVFTEGIHELRRLCGAFWLVDKIATSYMQGRRYEDIRETGIHFWTLKVENKRALLTCERDADDIIDTETIGYTDCPLTEIRVWACLQDKQVVLLLPSEY